MVDRDPEDGIDCRVALEIFEKDGSRDETDGRYEEDEPHIPDQDGRFQREVPEEESDEQDRGGTELQTAYSYPADEIA